MAVSYLIAKQPSPELFIMYLQIKKLGLQPDKYGKHIKVTMIGAYEDNGKWIKWVPLADETVIDALSKIKIPFEL